MNEISNAFDRFTKLVDRDIKGVHIGCYSVALIGLTIAIRKVRPFSKFKRPSDIPNHFIKERRELSGLVRRVDPNGALLLVEHKPLVNIPLIKPGQLPIKISGVNVSGLGLNWLQSIVAGQEIKFVPISKEKSFVQCQVLLVQNTKEPKNAPLNIGESLVKIGFAHIEPIKTPLGDDPLLLHYYKRLQAAENYALRKKLGFKYYIQPTKSALNSLVNNMNELSKKLTKLAKKQIKNVPQITSA